MSRTQRANGKAIWLFEVLSSSKLFSIFVATSIYSLSMEQNAYILSH